MDERGGEKRCKALEALALAGADADGGVQGEAVVVCAELLARCVVAGRLAIQQAGAPSSLWEQETTTAAGRFSSGYQNQEPPSSTNAPTFAARLFAGSAWPSG